MCSPVPYGKCRRHPALPNKEHTMNTKHQHHEITRYDTTEGGIRLLARWTVVVVGSTAMAVLAGGPSSGAATDREFQGPYEYQCFIEQPHWNVALDGPVPRCPGSEPARGSSPG